MILEGNPPLNLSAFIRTACVALDCHHEHSCKCWWKALSPAAYLLLCYHSAKFSGEPQELPEPWVAHLCRSLPSFQPDSEVDFCSLYRIQKASGSSRKSFLCGSGCVPVQSNQTSPHESCAHTWILRMKLRKGKLSKSISWACELGLKFLSWNSLKVQWQGNWSQRAFSWRKF